MLHIRAETHDCDIAIAGAGPAGAAAALRLVRQGWRVCLIDASAFPRDKVCGDFVGPAGLAEITDLDLGQLMGRPESNRIRSASLFLDGREMITQEMPQVAGLPDHGRVIPRMDFDNWLWEAATEAGAQFIQARITGFVSDASGVTVMLKGRDPIRARLLLGCDGSASTVSRTLQGNALDKEDRIVAVRAYYEGVEGDEDRCDLFFSSESFPGYYWLFPTGHGRANVGVGMVLETLPPTQGKLSELLEDLIAKDPGLKDRLGNARLEGKIVGFPLTTYNPKRRVVANRLMLLGDAAGLINPLNGEGIQYALESAGWAAEVALPCLAEDRLTAEDLAPYAAHVRQRMDYDMALAGLIIQIIRNRGMNPVWLKALEIITHRARKDEAYAEIAGGVLAGLTPAKSVVGTTMILGSAKQAIMTLGVGTFLGATMHQKGLKGFANDLTGVTLDMARATLSDRRAAVGWAAGVGMKGARLAYFVGDDLVRRAGRAVVRAQ